MTTEPLHSKGIHVNFVIVCQQTRREQFLYSFCYEQFANNAYNASRKYTNMLSSVSLSCVLYTCH